MGALLQLIGEPPDDQIATEAQVRVSQSVPPAAGWTETRGRLARVLASRSVMDWEWVLLIDPAAVPP
jgi:hypothetical protein